MRLLIIEDFFLQIKNQVTNFPLSETTHFPSQNPKTVLNIFALSLSSQSVNKRNGYQI